MAVQMTRAEYEKMYGVKPVFSSTSPIEAIQPLPVRMTQAEYDAMYRPEQLSTFGNIKKDISETMQGIKSTIASGSADRQGIRQDVAEGKVTPEMGTFQTLGKGFSTGTNAIFQSMIGAGKVLLSENAEKKVGEFFKGYGEAMSEQIKSDYEQDIIGKLESDDKDERDAARNIKEIVDTYKSDPQFKNTVDAAGGFAEMATYFLTAGPASTLTRKASDNIGDTIVAARNAVDPTIKKLNPTALEKVVKEIAKVEEKYAPIRKANTYAKDVDASRARIAASNVLENAVDENGLLQTTDAIKAYKAMTLDGTENVIRANLINEGKTVNLAELTKTLKTEIYASGLEGSDLIAALRKIDNEVEGLAERADNIGELSLAKLQDAKISHYNNINFNTPPEVKTYRKAVARAYKETIEQKSEVKVNVDGKDFDIKSINARLAEYLGDIERLERLNGRKVEGGRLGKYTASLAGTGIGMAAGSVGGGLGAAVGGILGGEAAQLLKGGAMSRTFKKGVKGGLPEDQILKKAAEMAKAGKKVDLKTPSKKVGAPKSVPKTKEITRTEGLIAKNVEAQKKAIKAGDFTLVATLKDVYENLVDKLKTLIKESKKEKINLDEKKVKSNAVIKKVFVKEKTLDKAQQKLDELIFEKDNLKSTLDNDPAKELQKYMGRGDNSLAQIQKNNEGTNAKSSLLDDIVTELGFDDLDDAQKAIDSYRENKSLLSDLEEKVKEQRQFVKKLKESTEDELQRLKPDEIIKPEEPF